MNQRALIAAATAALMPLTLVDIPTRAADEKEKCFGVAEAGQNDCASISGKHSCDDQSTVDWTGQGEICCQRQLQREIKGLTMDEAKMMKKG